MSSWYDNKRSEQIDWSILWSWLACITFCIAFYAGLVIFLMTVIATIQLPSVYH